MKMPGNRTSRAGLDERRSAVPAVRGVTRKSPRGAPSFQTASRGTSSLGRTIEIPRSNHQAGRAAVANKGKRRNQREI